MNLRDIPKPFSSRSLRLGVRFFATLRGSMPCLPSISTPNSQHPTPNIQGGEFSEHLASHSLIAYGRLFSLFLGRWLLDVGCWMFDSLR